MVAATNNGVPADEVWYTALINLADNNISTGKAYYIENTSGLFHLSVLDQNREHELWLFFIF
jgi:hypothetical protein